MRASGRLKKKRESAPKRPKKPTKSARNLSTKCSQSTGIQVSCPRASLSIALPNEIWNQILTYLSKKELKAVRLSGDKHLEVLASSRLFVTAYVAARRGVLDTFMLIATHPTIRHFIKELIYDGSWFDPPTGVSHVRNGHYRITDGCTDLPLATLFQEQEAIQSGEMIRCLKTAFAALTNVRRVAFADLSRTAGVVEDALDEHGGPLIARISSDSQEPYGAQCWQRRCNPGDCIFHKLGFQRRYGGFLALLFILADYAPTTFAELSLGAGRYSMDRIDVTERQGPSRIVGSDYGGIPDYALIPSQGIYSENFYHKVFRRLRKLDLTICFPTQARATNQFLCPLLEYGDLSALGELLPAADDLEELRLCGHVDTANLKISETLAGKSWSKLRILELRYYQATWSEMEAFLVRHQYCLKHVKLDYFNLMEGTWEDLLTFVESHLPELSLILGFVWEAGNAIEVRPRNEGRDTIWLPRKKEDRLYDDRDEPEPEDDISESSFEEELEYDSGSEGSDHEDLPSV